MSDQKLSAVQKLSPAGNPLPTREPEVLAPESVPSWRDLTASLKTAEVRALQSERLYSKRLWANILKVPGFVPKRVAGAVSDLSEAMREVAEYKRLRTAGLMTAQDACDARDAMADLEAAKGEVRGMTSGKASAKRKAQVAIAQVNAGTIPIAAALTSAASAMMLRDLKGERAQLDADFDAAVNVLTEAQAASLPAALRALCAPKSPLSK